jgi:hypothetical protein
MNCVEARDAFKKYDNNNIVLNRLNLTVKTGTM